MVRETPTLELLEVDDAVRLWVNRAAVPGRIERIEVLDGAGTVSTTTFAAGVDTQAEPIVLALTAWRVRPTDTIVVFFHRRHQPTSIRRSPLARSSFRLKIGVRPMTEPTPPAQGTAGSDITQTPGRDFINASFDYGTSRAVCGVFDRRRSSSADREIAQVAFDRATKVLGGAAKGAPAGDLGQQIDDWTIGRPRLRSAAWRTIFGYAPLEVHHLSATSPRTSDLVVTDGSVEFADVATGSERIRGAKRHLADLNADVPGTGMRGDELFERIYQRFAEWVRQELELVDPIARISVTFPTKLPPDKREELQKKLRPLAARVEMRIDEAVAAAGFSMMKRFGADYLLGVEAFKLQARCPEGGRLWEDPETWAKSSAWHENLLVVDVGGGTTDCALVRVRVAETTPPEAGNSPGRFHQLQPVVLASGGQLHLGGDQVTAEVFKLLREKLNIRPGDTRFAGVEKAGQRRATFDALWTAAEQVKLAGLADAAPAAVQVRTDAPSGTVAPRQVYVSLPERKQGDGVLSVDVTADDLGRILTSVTEQVSWLAAGIARGGLEVGTPEIRESVDRVLLSGGSMGSEAMRLSIENSLRSRFDADDLAATFVLEFDPEYCKSGTAIGAVYLDAVADLSPEPDAPATIERLHRGISYLDVDASRLYVNLAADFKVRQSTDSFYDDPVFRRGQALTLESNAPAFARGNEHYPVQSLIEIHRFDVSSSEQPRGTLWATSDAVGRDDVKLLSDASVDIRFEIAEDERITMLLCRGEPGWELTGDAVDVADIPIVASPLPDAASAEDAPADGAVVLAVALYEDAYQGGVGLQSPTLVLKEGTVVPVGGILVPITEGRSTISWRELVGEDGQRVETYKSLVDSPAGHHWMSIDTEGLMRFHRSRPKRLTVPRPLDLLSKPAGFVYEERMASGLTYDENADPFSGNL